MRRKYIEDFSELERMLVMDTNFIQYACNGYEDRGLLKCIIQIICNTQKLSHRRKIRWDVR